MKARENILTRYTMLAMGVISILFSIVFTSSILAFIGLGLIFWGAILAYIKNEDYAKKAILNATALSAIQTIDQTMKELGYNGEATYLPPKYLKTPEANKAYIPKLKETQLPTPEQTQLQENQTPSQNMSATLITPPGAELARLFEKTLNTSFTKVDLQYVQQNMSRLFVEQLEIAEDIRLETQDNAIEITIKNTIFKDTTIETLKLSDTTRSLGSPLASAIACALAKATGKLVKLNKEQVSEDNKTITIDYSLLKEQKEGQPK